MGQMTQDWNEVLRTSQYAALLQEKASLCRDEAFELAEGLVEEAAHTPDDAQVLDTILHYFLEPVDSMMGSKEFASAIDHFLSLLADALCSGQTTGSLPYTAPGAEPISKEALRRYLWVAWWLGVHAGIKEVGIHL
jgi:hypothetical protein